MQSGLLSKHCTGQAESRAVSTIAGQGTVAVLKSPRQWPMKCSGEEKGRFSPSELRFAVRASAVVSHSKQINTSIKATITPAPLWPLTSERILKKVIHGPGTTAVCFYKVLLKHSDRYFLDIIYGGFCTSVAEPSTEADIFGVQFQWPPVHCAGKSDPRMMVWEVLGPSRTAV